MFLPIADDRGVNTSTGRIPSIELEAHKVAVVDNSIQISNTDVRQTRMLQYPSVPLHS